MADFSLTGKLGAGGAVRLQPGRYANGPRETEAADKLPHSA